MTLSADLAAHAATAATRIPAQARPVLLLAARRRSRCTSVHMLSGAWSASNGLSSGVVPGGNTGTGLGAANRAEPAQ